ncbi:MAG: hypothetical protein OXL34_05375 [Gemmatimonadota bacterium]|nr:hypothetical protein [Gemmatimonadota bacterium]
MDIRFIAAIFLIAALMEMLAKMARKRRGEEEGLEDGTAPRRPADPLAGVIEELQRLPRGEEQGLEVAPEVGDRPIREQRVREREVDPRAPEVKWELDVPDESAPLPERPTLDPVAPPPVVEPVTLRGQIERMFEPMPQPAAAPVAVPEPPPQPKPVVPRRDRSPRPVEVRSREVRPREARDLVERAWTEERAAIAAVPEAVADGRRRRAEVGWGGEGGGPGLGSVRDLRRLVVAREVLGPPLALRGEEPLKDR